MSPASAQSADPLRPLDPKYYEGFIDLFQDRRLVGWYLAEYEIRAERFQNAWRRRMIVRPPRAGSAISRAVTLTLAPNPRRGAQGEKAFLGSEAQVREPRHYGRYEVVMQPSNTSGVISSFFTYTGPWFKNPHDEIDIEFLGKDTTSVYVNRFTAGKKLKGQFLPLGFDASKRPELYAFEWRPDSIIWHAAGKELYRTTLEDGPLPTHPSKIYINLWAGYNPTQELWAGRVADDATGAAKYFCVSYRAFDDDGPQCSDHFPPRAGAGGADR